MAALNQTYIATHSLVEKGTIYETKFLKAIDRLKKCKKLRKKLAEEVKAKSRAKATLEDNLSKIKNDNMKLQSKLKENQETSKLSIIIMSQWMVKLWFGETDESD